MKKNHTIKKTSLTSHEPFHELIKTRLNRFAEQVTETGLNWRNADIRYKKVIKYSPLPILITKGIEPIIDYVNPAWEKITGFKLKEVKGKNPNIVKSNKTPVKVHKKMWRELENGRTFKTELLFDKHKNGKVFQMSSTFFPVKRFSKPVFYAQIEHDITNRKIKEKYKTLYINIALLLARSKSIKDAVPKTLKYLCEGIGWELGELWLVEQDEKVLNFRGSWHSPYLNVSEFIDLSKNITFKLGKGLPGRVWKTGKPVWFSIHPKRSYFPNLLIAAKSGLTTALAFPIQIDSITIGVLTFFTIKTCRLDEELQKAMTSLGNHLGQFIAHKRAEENFKQLAAQQQLILNAVGQGIYGVDNNGILTFINPAAEKMLGWKYKELFGRRLHDIIHYTKSDMKSPLDYKHCPNHMIRQKEVKPQYIEKEIFWRKDGTNFPVEYVITPLPSNKEIAKAIVTFSDITKRHKLEELKKEFLAIAAHELKTPITALKLLSQLQINKLRKNIKLAPSDLESIDHELNRLTRIINDILDDQRVETGKLKLKFETIELTSLITNVIEHMGKLSPKQKLIYKVSNKINISVDAGRIEQVLINLISNAIKYSPKGKKIIISTKILKGQVYVSIKDEGIGIPVEKQDIIFDRFYQYQEGKFGGFGLGLYISKHIIELHYGEIWVKSKVGEGSTFTFSLPVK